MKKKSVKTVAAITALTIGTTCFAGAIYAKYVTSGKGSDQARVAKFGVVITAEGSAFAKTYAKDDSTYTLEADSVISSTADNVVAPGTEGTMAAFQISGKPETAVRVSYQAPTVELGDNWTYQADNEEEASFYCPIEITIGNTTLKGTTYDNADAFEEAVKNEIAKFTKDYKAGTDLSGIEADAPAISWKWAFEGNDDIKDTYLGDQAAAGNAATIELTVTATVTQVD